MDGPALVEAVVGRTTRDLELSGPPLPLVRFLPGESAGVVPGRAFGGVAMKRDDGVPSAGRSAGEAGSASSTMTNGRR